MLTTVPCRCGLTPGGRQLGLPTVDSEPDEGTPISQPSFWGEALEVIAETGLASPSSSGPSQMHSADSGGNDEGSPTEEDAAGSQLALPPAKRQKAAVQPAKPVAAAQKKPRQVRRTRRQPAAAAAAPTPAAPTPAAAIPADTSIAAAPNVPSVSTAGTVSGVDEVKDINVDLSSEEAGGEKAGSGEAGVEKAGLKEAGVKAAFVDGTGGLEAGREKAGVGNDNRAEGIVEPQSATDAPAAKKVSICASCLLAVPLICDTILRNLLSLDTDTSLE